MYTIINKNHDEDQQVITVRNKDSGHELTYYEQEVEHIADNQLR